MAVRQLSDGRWICYYRVTGQDGKSRVKKEYFGRGVEAGIKARERDSALNLKPRRPKLFYDGPLFWELAKAYTLSKNFRSISLETHLNRLKNNILPAFGNLPALGITWDDLDRYVTERRRSVKSSTVARDITTIKAVMNWSFLRQPPLIPANPIRDYRGPKNENAVIVPPTIEEIESILFHASPHLTRAILFSYYLGLRPGTSELLSLQWSQVFLQHKVIQIHSAHKGGPVVRIVPIHKNFLPLLTKWSEDDGNAGPVIHFRGKQIKSLKVTWKTTLKKAGITRRIRPYDLRHHFVTRALEEGADLKALSEIVGSRPETLMKYYQHVSREMHRQIVAKMPRLGLQNRPNKKNKIIFKKLI